MAWITPKTDWAVPDIVLTTDMNNIGNNLVEMRNGIDGSIYGTGIASASELDIVDDYQTFSVTGSTNINYIKIGNRFLGNQITLIFNVGASISLINNAGTPASGYGKILSASNTTVVQYDCVDLILWSAGEWIVKRIN